jgi:hypothetical protein
MNCGVILPPAAGTDLPNNPYREPWQPFLGSMRMYVRLDGGDRGSSAWNAAVKRGKVFVTSGPMIRLRVNGAGPGETVAVAAGDRVTVEAELSAPRSLRRLELVASGKVVASTSTQVQSDGVHRMTIRESLPAEESMWIAARGTGARIDALHQDAVAHTAAVSVVADGRPIRSGEEAARFIAGIEEQKDFYREKAVYADAGQRREALAVFDRAIGAFRQLGTPQTGD